MRGFGRVLGAVLALAAAASQAAPAGPPEPGRHAAQLCVATSPSAAPSCGPAKADVYGKASMSVRVDDVVYRLQLHSSQVDVVVMHNLVQIDEFTVPYEWAGSTLRFNDGDRASRYEVRFAAGRAER